jgi:hypothetical protein
MSAGGFGSGFWILGQNRHLVHTGESTRKIPDTLHSEGVGSGSSDGSGKFLPGVSAATRRLTRGPRASLQDIS